MSNIEDVVMQQVFVWSTKIALALFILLAFYYFARLLQRAINRVSQRLSFDIQLAEFFARSIKITLTLVGIITAIGTLGVDISALVAGLGLTGFAVGFALKDTITNMLSGVLILLYKPFTIKQRIQVANFDGIVVGIDLRYTQLDKDGDKILIPNSKLFTDPITVYK